MCKDPEFIARVLDLVQFRTIRGMKKRVNSSPEEDDDLVYQTMVRNYAVLRRELHKVEKSRDDEGPYGWSYRVPYHSPYGKWAELKHDLAVAEGIAEGYAYAPIEF